MIHLKDNPLLVEPLKTEHVKHPPEVADWTWPARLFVAQRA
jgi:hypothetical protein